MDNADENIDVLRRKLKKANEDLARLSEYVARVINDSERATRMSDNKIERLETNEKILEGQLELAVNEKFQSDEKLLAVEVERDKFERELDKLKLRHEKQETRLQLLRQDIESTNQQKREIFTKFKLVKSQESVHDAVVGALKRQFEEKIQEFLNVDASGSEASTLEHMNSERDSGNLSVAVVVNQRNGAINDNRVAGSTSNVSEQVNGDVPNDVESVSVESHSMESVSDHNSCQTMESVLRGRTQVLLTRLSMRKSSGTIIRRLTSTTSQVTETIKTREVVEIEQQPSNTAIKRMTSEAVVERRRPKRTLRCSLCSKPYVSKPSQALCRCQYRKN